MKGYNQTGSELGHLFYEEFGFPSNQVPPLYDVNAYEFNNLIISTYWTDTTEEGGGGEWAFYFDFAEGRQESFFKFSSFYGLAVSSGDVAYVPICGGIYLLGSGLIGLASLSRRKQENRR